ncbi:diaminopimelate epimerase [Ponticaulis sp.]|uniref:diaminopimelate epimerase n=1 Tax=Ponticaulis sp. TaxID=2020902 RepID=UPI00260F4EF5|nr:diaminopimelate epimerase [Ponticaulis sp.]MDF1680028.1 diaminopimelate epimerase [Ponticaulis sp.]
MHIFHMNGCGNRFVVFDGRARPWRKTADEIRQIAHPNGKQAFDQIIGMESTPNGDVFMRIWNADGSEVSACGNATRCVGWLVQRETGQDEILIETEAGLLKARAAGDDMITVDMGEPRLDWEDIPLAEKMDTRFVDIKIGPMDNPVLSRPSCVNMGNPHAVFFVDDVNAYDIPAVGPLAEWHPLFPEGVNVGFAQVIDRQTIRLRVWERGAGLTLACGTGACAAAVAAARLGRTERKVKMILDGGELHIEWRESDNHVLMTGPVELEGELQIAS